MVNKKGQFYIIAALIIIFVVIGFFGIKNQFKTSETPDKVYDLQKELSLESVKVVDYGVYSEEDQAGMNTLLQNFTDAYTAYAGSGRNLYFVFGNKESVTVKAYQDIVSGSIGVNVGGSTSVLIITTKKAESQSYPVNGNIVEVLIGNQKYTFTLKEGQNFYFMIAQDSQGGSQIAQG